METLFASGALIDVVIAVTILEALFLTGLHRATGRGVAPGQFVANLLSGLMLMLAVRTVIGGGWWGWTALCLMGAGIAHATDLWRRWQR